MWSIPHVVTKYEPWSDKTRLPWRARNLKPLERNQQLFLIKQNIISCVDKEISNALLERIPVVLHTNNFFLNRPLSWRFQIFLPCGEVCDSYWWRYSTEIRVLSLIGGYLRAKIQNCATTSDVISIRWISLFQVLTVREDRVRMSGIGWQLNQSYCELQTRYVN